MNLITCLPHLNLTLLPFILQVSFSEAEREAAAAMLRQRVAKFNRTSQVLERDLSPSSQAVGMCVCACVLLHACMYDV